MYTIWSDRIQCYNNKCIHKYSWKSPVKMSEYIGHNRGAPTSEIKWKDVKQVKRIEFTHWHQLAKYSNAELQYRADKRRSIASSWQSRHLHCNKNANNKNQIYTKINTSQKSENHEEPRTRAKQIQWKAMWRSLFAVSNTRSVFVNDKCNSLGLSCTQRTSKTQKPRHSCSGEESKRLRVAAAWICNYDKSVGARNGGHCW